MPHRIVLVDEHQLFRSGLNALFRASTQCAVVGEANDARAAYRAVEETNPDVVLTEIALPGDNGISLTRELIRRQRLRKVLILTGQVSEQLAAQAFAAGALGYFVKHESVPNLMLAIDGVARGQRHLAPMLSQAKIEVALGSCCRGPLSALSRREREVFEMLVRGLNNPAIGKQLFISVKTVETHRARIMKKLEMHSLSDMVCFAARNGLLADEMVDLPIASAG